jgi:hypothetical protein
MINTTAAFMEQFYNNIKNGQSFMGQSSNKTSFLADTDILNTKIPLLQIALAYYGA